MKKNIFIAAASFVLFVNASAFAKASSNSSTTFVTPKIQDEFKEEFGQVQNVKWTKRPDNLVVATFTMNEKPVDAYFDEEGNYTFCTTSISKENLPIKVGLAVNKNFENKNIRAVLQMANAEGTSYFIMASDTNGKTKVWKAYTDGQIELFKSI